MLFGLSGWFEWPGKLSLVAGSHASAMKAPTIKPRIVDRTTSALLAFVGLIFQATSEPYLPNPFQRVVQIVTYQAFFSSHMGEYAVALSLTDVEGLAVSRVDQPVRVPTKGLLLRQDEVSAS